MWRRTLETERSHGTAVTWVAVAAWRQAVVFYGSLSWYRAAGRSVLGGGAALGLAVVAASRTRMCSRMQAMTRSLPPHLGQVSMSMAKTRFRRRIRVMGARGLSGLFAARMLMSIDHDSAQEQKLKDICTESGTGAPGLFEGTAAYYARYRPKYPVAMFDHLVDRFNLGTLSSVLDLGLRYGPTGVTTLRTTNPGIRS